MAQKVRKTSAKTARKAASAPATKPAAKPVTPPPSRRAQADLDTCLASFRPEISAIARSAISCLRERLPGAFEFVYDNAYALVIGYGPTERPSEAIFSVVTYPKKVSLCFLQGLALAKAGGDPKRLLQGAGNQVRFIRLPSAAVLDSPDIRALMTRAVTLSPKKFDKKAGLKTTVRAVSAKKRPRV